MANEGQTPFGISSEQGGKDEAAITEETFITENIGEGKRWANSEEALKELAKKAIHADRFIDTLKAEKHELEIKVNTMAGERKTTEEILAALKNQSPSKEHSGSDELDNSASTKASLTREDVEQILAAERNKEITKEKDRRAKEALVKAFGNEAAVASILTSYAGDNIEKKRIIVELGHTDPAALVTFLKTQQTISQPGIDLGVDTETTQDNEGSLSKEAIAKIKRENPRLYNSIDFQRKLAKHYND